MALISESWERSSEPLENIIKIDNYKFISNPFQRPASVPGGRPAILVNTSKFSVDCINQTLVDIPFQIEATWCLLTPKNVTNSSIVKKIAVCSFYSKPNSRKKAVLIDHIYNTFHLLSAKFGEGLFWIIGGDKNDLNIQQILNLNPRMKQCVMSPTRLNPPQILDICVMDMSQFYQSPVIEAPLQVDQDKTGVDSDHFIVTITPIGSLSDKKSFQKKRIQFRPLNNDQGYFEMGNILKNFNWEKILNIESPDEQMKTFQSEMFGVFDQCFPLKTKVFLNDSEPYYNDKLVLLKRKKNREYNRHRRSVKYISLHKLYKEELTKSKRIFYRKKIHALRTSNPRQWHKNLKRLITNDVAEEKIEVENIKNLSDTEQVELIAEKFAEVANLYEPLDRSKIEIPPFTFDDIPKVSCAEVKEILENMNTNKSCRKNDVPAKIFKKYADLLCKPLAIIINNCIQSGVWPDYLKHEIVTPIPKVPHPKVIDDLRNISGLMNINKIIEKVTCKMIVSDMKKRMDPAQFGNRKGVSIQHYLVKMFDNILKALDMNSRGEVVAVIATMFDWRQAFPRQDPTLAIKSFIKNGVRPALIPILMSFFENRRMTVKWKNVMSAVKSLKGGVPKGAQKGSSVI